MAEVVPVTETGFRAGQPVKVTEQQDGSPRPGGIVYPATIVKAEGMYLHVAYDDPSVFRGRPDLFYASTGWRAWDGELRWRLAPVAGGQS